MFLSPRFFPVEAGKVEVLASDLDDGGVELPAVEEGREVVEEEEAGNDAGAEVEEGEGAGGTLFLLGFALDWDSRSI